MSALAHRRDLPINDRRDDVQGLRAVAVILVVTYHLWPGVVPAGFVGVDIFFVISGFLITRNLLASPPRRRRDVVSFWERRVRRLLPAAFVVLVSTLFASYFLAPETEWIRTAKEAVASALYIENWYLVQQSTNYLSAEVAPTPVQHFWSLSIEEQFYLFWPLVIMGVAMFVGRSHGVRSVARGVIAVVLVASLAYSIYAAISDPTAAYFMTTTRIWELAAGGLLATWVSPVRFPIARAVVAWLGLALLVASAFVYSSSTPWPGYQALLPVVGTMMFIAAASAAKYGPGLVLGSRSVQWTGDASYSIYLWHWPLVVLAPTVLGGPLTLAESILILVLTFALSWVTFTFVENRWRIPDVLTPRSRAFETAVLGVLVVSLVAGAQMLGVRLTERGIASTAGDVATDRCFGARAQELGAKECPTAVAAELAVQPTAAGNDRAKPFDDGCMAEAPYVDTRSCTYGTGATKVALVGNSHAAQWLPALEDIARKQDLTITTFVVGTCSAVDAPLAFDSAADARGCADWRDQTIRATLGDAFDLIIVSQRSVVRVQGESRSSTYDAWVDGARRLLNQWTQSGARVLVIRDTPFPGTPIPECVAANIVDQTECSGDQEDWLPADPTAEAAEGMPNTTVLDLTDYLCTDGRCNAVIGGVIAYFDDSHLTATFVRSMTPYLAPTIETVLSGARDDVSVASGGR